LAVSLGVSCHQSISAQISSPAASHRAVLNRYCVTCHNQELKTAGLTLDNIDVDKISEGAQVWEKVLDKLRVGAMPPAGMPRPDKATSDALVAWLETELTREASANPDPGRPAIQRLNRAEYTNAIRDLLAVDIDGTSLLPADDVSYGFDNIGDVLSVSTMLMERYMSAARKIAQLAIGDHTLRSDTYDVHRFLVQEDRISEDLPFGSRGGMAIRHFFPLDGDYIIQIRLRRDYSGEVILGIDEPHQLDVLLDGARIKMFQVGGEQDTPGSDAESNPVEYRRRADAGLEVRFPAEAGTRLIGVTFVKETTVPEGIFQPLLAGIETKFWRDNPLSVNRVTLSGPYDTKGPGDTPSRRKIFLCRPTGSQDEEACAEKIFSALARRAYRRPVTDADIQTLLGLYREVRNAQGFEAGIGMALRAILVSPEFLFRIVRDPADVAPATAYKISDLEVASRLSFFLWSSIPDDQLLDLAEAGKLKDPAILEEQVRRMLSDPRSQALVDNFAGQWLYLRNMRLVTPEQSVFPTFDENLRQAFRRETELFFESMLREDRSVMDLLTADYTFVNERLARHYQIPNIYGNHFRRVTLGDEHRKGLLGQGSILTVTSYANRTSPVLRGKWLLENMLGTPPPPPPPNVPALKDRGEDGEALSVRKRMEQHRANPVCASCHAAMDPLGFALENFDGIGRWRTTSEANTPIDASGVLPDGTRFEGPVGLRELLVSRRQQFVTTVTERLLTYALGRGVESHDAPAVRRIIQEAAPDEYRWSSIIMGIVRSVPFQMRRSPES
jgi:cytochrome c5